MIKNKLISNFENIFAKGTKDCHFYFAPGRVNLVGEHIDYNGGHVFPYAINKGTYLVARKRNDDQVRFYSLNIKRDPFIYETLYYDEKIDPVHKWVNYPKCVFSMIRKAGYKINSGFDLLFFGNIPGSGLSSSASIEVVFAIMLNDLCNLNIDKKELAKICQRVENVCYGLKTGIMDQFAVIFGKKNNAIFLNCSTLDYEYAPLHLGKYKLVVTNSNIRHSLSSSKYNERKSECERALEDLNKVIKINNLCELTPEQFNQYKGYIKDDICRKRAHFVVNEEERTKQSLIALKANNINEFVQQINESGKGLKEEYEATVEQIDYLVDTSLSFPFCIGSRMIGGGWGGNILAIVEKDKVKEYEIKLCESYKKKFGIEIKSNILECEEGARKIDECMF